VALAALTVNKEVPGMARDTPLYDRARELLSELESYLELPDDDLVISDPRMRVTALTAHVVSHLAIAEALHGVVYTANAAAV
jgi:hypothetical protein